MHMFGPIEMGLFLVLFINFFIFYLGRIKKFTECNAWYHKLNYPREDFKPSMYLLITVVFVSTIAMSISVFGMLVIPINYYDMNGFNIVSIEWVGRLNIWNLNIIFFFYLISMVLGSIWIDFTFKHKKLDISTGIALGQFLVSTINTTLGCFIYWPLAIGFSFHMSIWLSLIVNNFLLMKENGLRPKHEDIMDKFTPLNEDESDIKI